MRILIVEDDDSMRQVLEKICTLRGHEVTVCPNGEEGWKAYREGEFQMVILDWVMPGMDGLRLCRNIRKIDGDRAVILMISVRDQAEDLVEILDAGANDFISKPLDFRLLNVRLALAEKMVEELDRRREAERDLVESRQTLQAILQNSNDAIFIKNPDGEYTYLNPEAGKMLGIPPSSALGRREREFVSEKAARESEKIDGFVIQSQEKFTFEQVRKIRGQSRTSYHITKFPYFLPGGKLLGIIDLIRETSQQKLGEEVFRRQRELEVLVNQISSSLSRLPHKQVERGIEETLQIIGDFGGFDRGYIYLLALDGRSMDSLYEWQAEGVMPVEKEARRLSLHTFPWIFNQILEEKPVHLSQWDDIPADEEKDREALMKEGIQGLVAIPLCYAGAVVGFLGFDSSMELRSLSSEELSLYVILGEVVVNALERKRSMVALLESERRYRELVESSPDAVLVERKGRIVYINESGLDLLRYQHPLELMNLGLEDIFDGSEKKIYYKILDTERGRSHSRLWETVFRRKGGTKVQVEISCIRTRFQEEWALVVIARDITETSKLREKNLKMQKLADLGQLSAIIAHEIRNPLATTFLNFEYLLSEVSLPEEYQENLQDIYDALQRIQKIIDDILAFARPLPSSLNEEDLHSIIDRSIRSVEGDLTSKGISIHKVFDHPRPEVLVDREQIIQVFVNLFINAGQAMKDGGEMWINTRREGASVVVEIEDTGGGIDEEERRHIFEPFYTTKSTGTGLGLAVVRRILEKHQCRIEVESKVEKGTKFILYFHNKEDRA